MHVVDNLALVLQCVSLLDAGHEVGFDHRVGWAVEQVPLGEALQSTKQKHKESTRKPHRHHRKCTPVHKH